MKIAAFTLFPLAALLAYVTLNGPSTDPNGLSLASSAAEQAPTNNSSLEVDGSLPNSAEIARTDHLEAGHAQIEEFFATGRVGTPTPETTTNPLAWDQVEPEVYDSLLGEGFGRAALLNDWCDADGNGMYQADYEDASFNPEGKIIDGNVRSQLDAISAAHEPVVRQRAEAAMDELQHAVHELWFDGGIHAEPNAGFSPAAAASRLHDVGQGRGPFSYADCFTTSGWSVSVLVDSHQFPSYGNAMKELELAKLDRVQELRRLIAEL